MSLLSAIENAEHSTAAWFEKEWTKIHAEAPTIVNIADKTLPYVSMLLQTVLAQTAGAGVSAEAAKVLATAQNDLDVANAVIYDTGATPTAASAISAVQSNLTGILNSTHITNATSTATVTKAVSELGILASAITGAIPAAPAA